MRKRHTRVSRNRSVRERKKTPARFFFDRKDALVLPSRGVAGPPREETASIEPYLPGEESWDEIVWFDKVA